MTADLRTIFALASGAGLSGVAVIRISGPGACGALELLTGRECSPPRRAARRKFVGQSGDVLDDGLVIWFPGPQSFTGEDVAELHIHGGVATVDAVLDALAAMEGLRLAEPGEFTRRAFDNGKLDLTGVEALSDLISAETDAQRRQALRQLDGAFGARCDDWRNRLIEVLARLEAWIDFPEEDLPETLFSETKHQIQDVSRETLQYLDDQRVGERIREGLKIAILGPPNAGKSSLLNLLAGREAAIVSDQAGTTRDIIEVRCGIAGVPVTFSDSAGLRQTSDAIEEEGVRRAEALAASADFCLLLEAPDCPPVDRAGILSASRKSEEEFLFIRNKSDINERETGSGIRVSLRTGDYVEEFLAVLEKRVEGLLPQTGSAPLTRRRHREALEDCAAALGRAAEGSEIELIAEDVRQAARSLGRITGRVDVEDVLDRLFGEFCIGK